MIKLVDAKFDVLVLADKNLRYQQNLQGRSIALVELPTNRWPVLLQLAEKITLAVSRAQPGSYLIIEA